MKKFFLTTLLVITLAACNLPGSASPTPLPTVDAGMVGTIAAMTLEAMSTPTPTFTATPAPTTTSNVTATVTATITPTYELPLARFDGDTNCRQGPGTNYEIITVIHSGQKAEIVGKAEKGNYWIIKNPDGEGTCWVAGDYAQTSGSLHLLPTMTAPPTPTPEPPKAPTWKDWSYSCAFAAGGSDVTVNLIWSDHSKNEDGYHIYRDDQVVATFGPDITTFTEVTFVAAGQSVSYYIEVYNATGKARTSSVTATCQ